MSKNKKELRPYKTSKISNWPTGLKVFILKTWTAGMVFFFLYMSLEIYTALPFGWDRLLIVALVLILFNEYLINGLIRNMELDPIIQNKHCMFVRSKWSIVFNIPYILFVVFITSLIGIILFNWGISLSKIFWPEEPAKFEPFTFGLLYYGVDTFFVTFVWHIKKIIREKKMEDKDKNEV